HTPETATSASFTARVVRYALDWSPTSTSNRFQTPVATRTANAGHARSWKRRATARVDSRPPARRTTGTSAASTTWPPTHTVAATMWRNRRTVVAWTGNMPVILTQIAFVAIRTIASTATPIRYQPKIEKSCRRRYVTIQRTDTTAAPNATTSPSSGM